MCIRDRACPRCPTSSRGFQTSDPPMPGRRLHLTPPAHPHTHALPIQGPKFGRSAVAERLAS
eukprot:13452513-Alexandrium_andersonii.AAC.1